MNENFENYKTLRNLYEIKDEYSLILSDLKGDCNTKNSRYTSVRCELKVKNLKSNIENNYPLDDETLDQLETYYKNRIEEIEKIIDSFSVIRNLITGDVNNGRKII